MMMLSNFEHTILTVVNDFGNMEVTESENCVAATWISASAILIVTRKDYYRTEIKKLHLGANRTAAKTDSRTRTNECCHVKTSFENQVDPTALAPVLLRNLRNLRSQYRANKLLPTKNCMSQSRYWGITGMSDIAILC